MAYAKNKNTDSSGIKLIRRLFGGLSEELMEIRDEEMHIFTTLAASGAAIFYYIFDAFLRTAKKQKIRRTDLRKLILLTARASANRGLNSEDGLENMINHACTPNGMTIEGIKFLRSKKVGGLIGEALQKTTDRSKEIGKDLIN
jgi:pyrroline-5-carboxylate reductase